MMYFLIISETGYISLAIRKVSQNAIPMDRLIYSDLNMHRCFRNISKNASFFLTCHFATTDNMHANIFFAFN